MMMMMMMNNDASIILIIRNIISNGWDLILLSLPPIYVLLATTALASRYVPLLSGLASHGKTSAIQSVGTTTTTTTTKNKDILTSEWLWISKSYFSHFYTIGIISWMIVFIMSTLNHQADEYSTNENNNNEAIYIAQTLLLIHLIRRCYESYCIQKSNTSASKMHILGYLLGVGHYLVLPFVFFDCPPPPPFSTNTTEVSQPRSQKQDYSWLHIVLLFVTTIFNLYFQKEQYQHHLILASMRQHKTPRNKKNDDICNPSNYTIPPKIRWFRYVFCPHYLAEILIYVTWAIQFEISSSMSSSSQQQQPENNNFVLSLLQSASQKRHWFLLIWVTTNLTISALKSLEWYRSKFATEDLLDKNRTAIIPGWI